MLMSNQITNIAIGLKDLPLDKVAQVQELVETLRRDCGMSPASISDEWTREDELDFGRAALLRFESEHPDEDWGIDYSAVGASK